MNGTHLNGPGSNHGHIEWVVRGKENKMVAGLPGMSGGQPRGVCVLCVCVCVWGEKSVCRWCWYSGRHPPLPGSGWREAGVMRRMLFDVKRWDSGGCWRGCCGWGCGGGGVRQSSRAGYGSTRCPLCQALQPLPAASQLRSSEAPFLFPHSTSNHHISPWPRLTRGSCTDCTALGVESYVSYAAEVGRGGECHIFIPFGKLLELTQNSSLLLLCIWSARPNEEKY